MTAQTESQSRKLLRQLRDMLAEPGEGQERLNRVVTLISESMGAEVCSIYLFRDEDTLELCATKGLRAEAVHQTRLRLGEGLIGRVAKTSTPINTANAQAEKGFIYRPETGEEIYSGFLGVPIQRLGEKLGVLVISRRAARMSDEDEIYALEVVAMVLAEMSELGAFVGEGEALAAPHKDALTFRGGTGQEGLAIGRVWLHEPRVAITNLVADDPVKETERLQAAVDELRSYVDQILADQEHTTSDQLAVMEAYKMFANSRGWISRMQEDIARGLSAEAAVEKEQSSARARLETVPDPYLRDRLHDLDDLSNRLLRILTGQGNSSAEQMRGNCVLVARNIGPAELLDYGRRLKGVVLEEGSVGSHAAIVARALGVPLVIHAEKITTEAVGGDLILVDGDQGLVHLRPKDEIANAFRDKIALQAQAQLKYADVRDLPAIDRAGVKINLHMNAGVMADLPSLDGSGAEAVGLFRTELQFLIRSNVPKRSELTAIYARVIDAAHGKRIVFRTLDIGSDKVLPYMKRPEEPNPAMGWRAIRVGLDKPGILRMQVQSLLRAANGGPMSIMFPFVTEFQEFREARNRVLADVEHERRLGHPVPSKLEIGAMLETPSLAFAPKAFFEMADFISIGGNDLKQFFFAADRENEQVRKRYDMLNSSFLAFLEEIVARCSAGHAHLSYCGEDAGRPIEAACLAAMGIRTLSMRAPSIGPVKYLIRQINLAALRQVIDKTRKGGADNVRDAVTGWLQKQGAL
ncbi:MAG: phosphoenolpyruvate--protein phosphotransferase [Paracoccaceae bacterium]